MNPIFDQNLSCPAFAELVDAVLDRTASAELLDHPHGQLCATCHDRTMAAKVILAGTPMPVPPSGLSERIVVAALAERQVRQRRNRHLRQGLLSLTALLIVGAIGFAVWPSGNDLIEPRLATVEPKPMIEVAAIQPKPRLDQSMSKASDALASLTREVTSPAISSTRHLRLPTELPNWNLTYAVESDVSLTHLPTAARTGLEPVTSSTRRALNLFMRDTGLSREPKPKL